MASKVTNEKEEGRTVHPVDPEKVRANDLMAVLYWVKVKTARPKEMHVFDLDHKTDFRVLGAELIARCYSADQVAEEIKVTKTGAAEILISAYNRPITVCFDKADGEQRILRGRLIRPEPLLGRSLVEDLDVADGYRIRQVDHRTIKFLILEGIKYVVK